MAPLHGVVALLCLTAYASVGNMAAFFEIAAAVRLDRNRQRVRLLPLLIIGFLVSIISVSRAAISQTIAYFMQAELHWDKTARFRKVA